MGHLMRGRVLRWTGRVLIGAGTFILLFLAYQLWGTGFITSHHQTDLKHKFYAGVRAAQATTAPTTTVSAPPVVKPNLGSGIPLMEIPKINLSMMRAEGVSAENLTLHPHHSP